jgi:hypothetical protein
MILRDLLRPATPNPLAAAPTSGDVASLFRELLGREPESVHAVAGNLANCPTLLDLIKSIAGSEEYGRRFADYGDMGRALAQLIDAPPQRIQHTVEDDLLDRMLARVRAEWAALGDHDPHYSVLSEQRFRAAELNDATRALFYQSGRYEIEVLERFEARAGISAGHGVCLEFGCGVGRTTRFLAERFARVVAVDISPGNLAACRAYMDSTGLANVETVQIASLDDVAALPEFDCLFSRIVLQHNPPPIQQLILAQLLPKARQSAFFQIPTDISGYHFDAATYLDSVAPEMEMHCLPRHLVLQLIRQAGLTLIDMVPDNAIGAELGSFTFFATR